MKKFSLILIGILFFISCNNDCKECYTVLNDGTPSEQIQSHGEKCGTELDDFNNTNFVDITGSPIPAYCQ